MTFVIEHYDPKDDKYYTTYAGNEEAADQFKKVLEHLGMKEVTVFEEPDHTEEEIKFCKLLRYCEKIDELEKRTESE